jgi:thiamine-phosphate pyrophosphorylase
MNPRSCLPHRVLCLVTDRRRLAAAVGEPAAHAEDLLLAQVQGAIRGGIDVVQIRERDLEAAVLAALVRRCLQAADGTSVCIVVNDRLDVALATGAHGVHLREDSIAVAAARHLAPARFAIGRSVHAVEALDEAAGADYVIAGTVHPSVSKPDSAAVLGLTGLARIVSAARPCPVWAIGGVTRARIPALVAGGARGVAGIGEFIPAGRRADLVEAVHEITAEMRLAFDSSAGVS